MARKGHVRRKKSIQIQTSHRIAASKPPAGSRIARLEQEWFNISNVEKGERLLKLIDLGCSRRGLAEALHVGTATIYRCIMLARLNPSQREELRKGSSQKRMLMRKKAEAKKRAIQERWREEKETGRYSKELASLLLEFASSGAGGLIDPLNWRYLSFALQEAKRMIAEPRLPLYPQSVKLPDQAENREIFRLTKPTDLPIEDTAFIPDWLAAIAVSVAPHWIIAVDGIDQAEERAHKMSFGLSDPGLRPASRSAKPGPKKTGHIKKAAIHKRGQSKVS